MTELTAEIREGLLALDTPTVCNALEVVNPARRARGFNIRPFVCVRPTLPPMLGQLPHILGTAPIYLFPSALLRMTFLSFFIGIFLQLMWEELPITEPL